MFSLDRVSRSGQSSIDRSTRRRYVYIVVRRRSNVCIDTVEEEKLTHGKGTKSEERPDRAGLKVTMLSGQCPHSDPGFGELCRHVGASIGRRHVKNDSGRLPREAVMETRPKRGKLHHGPRNKHSTAITTISLNAGRQPHLGEYAWARA